MTAAETGSIAVGERLLAALAGRDFETFGACLAPAVRLRALVPSALREDEGRAAVVDRYRLWYGSLDGFDLVDSEVAAAADRLRIRYRIRCADPEERVVEQHAYGTVENGLIAALDLVCSGFRPAPPR